MSLRRQLALANLAILTLVASHCAPSDPGATLIQAGSRPFATLAKGAVEVSIVSGGSWTATFRKNGPLPTDWVLIAGPGKVLLDRMAKGGLIEHVMSTLQTLQVEGPAPHGSLESFGLNPPHFAIRWKTEGGSYGEVRLAHQMSGSSAGFGTLVVQGVVSPVAKLQGALYRMVETITTFESLRQQQILAPWIPDDFDEVEISSKGQKRFYAQRAGETWADAKGKALTEPKAREITATLERLVHAQAMAFVDDLPLTQKLNARLQKAPELSILLKDRKGNPLTLRLGWGQLEEGRDELLASSTHRLCADQTPCVFVTHRRVLMAIQDLLAILGKR